MDIELLRLLCLLKEDWQSVPEILPSTSVEMPSVTAAFTATPSPETTKLAPSSSASVSDEMRREEEELLKSGKKWLVEVG